MSRIEKKHTDEHRDLTRMLEWFQDFRGALLEAMDENIDLRIIVRQFKRQMLRRGVYNRFFKRSRMSHYVNVALDRDR